MGRNLVRSLMFLLGMNLVTLISVFVFDWSIFSILFIYWVESGVIGFFNVFKIVKVGKAEFGSKKQISKNILIGYMIFSIIFFIIHFGMFMAVHFVFLYSVFFRERLIVDFLMIIPIVAMFVSHGYSYKVNFLDGKEYDRKNWRQQMREPYARIVLMQLVLILGGFIVLYFERGELLAVLFVVLKTGIDLFSHLREHGRKRIIA